MQLTCANIAFALALIAVLAPAVAGCRGGEPAATPTVAVPTGTPTPVATPTRAPGTAPPTPTPVELGPAVVIGDVVLPVELAITPEERRQGLSDRPSLAPGTGMLFVFESDGHRQFWMKNMHFPLDMVWIGPPTSARTTVRNSPPGWCVSG